MEYKELSKNPVNVVLQLVGAKWKLLIIKELLTKDMRFVELKKKAWLHRKSINNLFKRIRARWSGHQRRIQYTTSPC